MHHSSVVYLVGYLVYKCDHIRNFILHLFYLNKYLLYNVNDRNIAFSGVPGENQV